ncbi:lytic murein transglycosylase B [Xylophilus sp. GOD-11R]|uniref:lytic murein transglycosylase B n=1 Tax=Xylophilus sp. GOD-11R TaxID=3089814 RepID=UPI00298D42E1|nr:lytic murein transglycosylase B [Xylophilus sp. GOD-11R]WPB59101.1 lytic murein transglycosylase B [Xylophilus sp. GOD-11R]
MRPLISLSLRFPEKSLIAAFVAVSPLAFAVDSATATSHQTTTSQARPHKKQTATKPAAPVVRYAGREDVMQFADALAARRGLDADWTRRTLGQAAFLPYVPKLVLPPPSGTPKNWKLYRSRFVEPIRIRAGVRFWAEHGASLARAEAQYGVPAEIIVGIIGVETIYGQQMGKVRILDALATLAFDFPDAHPRAKERADFFRGELEQFLVMAERGTLDATTAVGSYAGAMGLPQFMPSSWSRWAVDFDGDGRIDLSRSVDDAIGSVASYFRAFGWKTGMPATYAVSFDASTLDLPALLAPDILPTFSTQALAAKGVALDGEARNHVGPLALVELQNGDDAPTFVAGTENFYVITRYNWSSYYAMAVLDLGAAVAAAR